MSRTSRSSPAKDFILAWGPAVGWAVLLLLLNELRELPPTLRPVMDLLGDKVVHVLLYTTLGAALAWGRIRVEGRVSHPVLLLVGYAYGGITEWHQSYVPGRTASVADWGANVVGVTLGYVLILVAVSLLGLRLVGGAQKGRRGEAASPEGEDGPAEGGAGYQGREARGRQD